MSWKKQIPLQKSWLYYKVKIHYFNLIWSLEVLLVGLSASVGIVSSLSLEVPSAGMVVEAKAYWKSWEATPSWGTSVVLLEDVSFETSSSFDYLCWLRGRGSWGRTSWTESAIVEATSPWVEGRSEARMAGGKNMLSGLLSSEEASTPAWFRASSQVWAQ